jgi:hypothetical protein
MKTQHVFISYSQQDAEFATVLENELNDNFHVVWRDKSSIQGGSEWEQEIKKALGCSYALIVICTKASIDSKWVKFEIEFAQNLSTVIPIIPLQLGDCRLPMLLSKKQVIDFSFILEGEFISQIHYYKESLKKLLRALEESRPILRHLRDLKDPNENTRENAAHKIGNMGDPIAAVALTKALSDLDVDVKLEAAIALGKIKANSAVKALIRLLDEEQDPDVCAAAATALGDIGKAEACIPLISKLTHHDRFVKANAALALGKLGEKSAVEPLISLMRNDGISDVREASAIALARIGGDHSLRALKRVGLDSQKLLKKTK